MSLLQCNKDNNDESDPDGHNETLYNTQGTLRRHLQETRGSDDDQPDSLIPLGTLQRRLLGIVEDSTRTRIYPSISGRNHRVLIPSHPARARWHSSPQPQGETRHADIGTAGDATQVETPDASAMVAQQFVIAASSGSSNTIHRTCSAMTSYGKRRLVGKWQN